MKTLKNMINLFKNIIIKPRATIMSIDIISYDKELMDRLFIVISMIYGVIFSIFFMGKINLGIIIILPILAPFIVKKGNQLYAIMIYILLKLIGKEINVNSKAIQILFNPILFLYLIFLIISTILRMIFNNIFVNIIVFVMIISWLNIIIFLIIHYKLKQNVYRSIVILIIPTVIALLLLVI